MHVFRNKNLGPKLRLAALHKIPSLLLEHRVVIRDRNKFFVAEALGIRNVCEVWVTLLAELSDYQWLVNLYRSQ